MCSILVCGTWGQDLQERKVAIVGNPAQFQCSVQSQSGEAAEVQLWWQIQNENITNSNKYEVRFAHI